MNDDLLTPTPENRTYLTDLSEWRPLIPSRDPTSFGPESSARTDTSSTFLLPGRSSGVNHQSMSPDTGSHSTGDATGEISSFSPSHTLRDVRRVIHQGLEMYDKATRNTVDEYDVWILNDPAHVKHYRAFKRRLSEAAFSEGGNTRGKLDSAYFEASKDTNERSYQGYQGTMSNSRRWHETRFFPLVHGK